MTSHEIREASYQNGANFWIKEIALQLAILNEARASERRVVNKPIPCTTYTVQPPNPHYVTVPISPSHPQFPTVTCSAVAQADGSAQ